MNGVFDRTVIAQVVIVLAVCIGAWFVFVEPRAVDAQLLQEEVRMGSLQAEGINHETVQRLAERLDEVRSRVRQIEQRGEITRDSSHLYTVVMDLARKHNVVVSSLSPGNPAPTQATSRTPRGSNLPNEQIAVHREISISASGRYADIALFANALQSLRGYIEVHYLSVTASSTKNVVNARIICRTVRFELPANLYRMLGADDAMEGVKESDLDGGQSDA